MIEHVKILCCRISWMKEYRSREERPFSYHSYIRDGNTPAEALNFRACDDNLFRGYVPVGDDKSGNYGKIAIERLGASKNAERTSPVVVVFCAPHEQNGGLRIVGFYPSATVLRKPEISELPDRTPITRVIADSAVLIPEAERHFAIPGRKEGGFGQSSLWYGLNEETPLRSDVLKYVQNQTALPGDQPSVIEYRRKRLHERWEGRANSRHLIHEKGYCCDACNYSISEADQPIWGSGFELHHLLPWADLNEGDERALNASDFAVLCSTCHRAIHRSLYVSDVATFRTKVLAKRGF
ncbi:MULTISPECIES: HNH endonuclease [Pacificibacter]|uniref:HNH endonuclease n=1 Tax=Pacificibacter TaxID=1042323 RepID=UPI001C081BA1|nr:MULTISPECIES: HNH endonuclease [Pacificibacter]MBU2934497.1 HNH endonuclease [Pacificibacter marinus]MDO6617117.1 HNH endonuclease [Pacificibacter sp. 1_MG-2023]